MIVVDHPDGTQTKKVVCFKSQNDDQIVTGLRTTPVSDFHDGALVAATRDINGILERVRRLNTNPKQELAFLNTGNGLLLAWTEHGLGPLDDDEDIDRDLCLVPAEPSAEPRAALTVSDYIKCVGECKHLFPGGSAELIECIRGCRHVSVRPDLSVVSQ
jgi:hypothetical protein